VIGTTRPADRSDRISPSKRSAYVVGGAAMVVAGWIWGSIIGWEPRPICTSGLDECDGPAEIFEEIARFATPVISIAVFVLAFIARPAKLSHRALWAGVVAVSFLLVYRSIGGVADVVVALSVFALLMAPRIGWLG
jgi:hypothetical protein